MRGRWRWRPHACPLGCRRGSTGRSRRLAEGATAAVDERRQRGDVAAGSLPIRRRLNRRRTSAVRDYLAAQRWRCARCARFHPATRWMRAREVRRRSRGLVAAARCGACHVLGLKSGAPPRRLMRVRRSHIGGGQPRRWRALLMGMEGVCPLGVWPMLTTELLRQAPTVFTRFSFASERDSLVAASWLRSSTSA